MTSSGREPRRGNARRDVLYSDAIERDREPELNRLLRDFTVRRLDALILSLQADRLALLTALERQGKAKKAALQGNSNRCKTTSAGVGRLMS